MSVYSASQEENLRTRALLKDWASEGFLTEAQYREMELETVCGLRRTSFFLRLVLFLFTVLLVGAAVGLFFTLFLSSPSSQITGIWLLIFAAIAYIAAETAASQRHLYRYGIEEALAVCAVALLCAGMEFLFFTARDSWQQRQASAFLVPAAGAIASLWIWLRFGFSYAFLAAMVFVLVLPHYWTQSHSAQHLIVAVFYAIALIIIGLTRRRHRSVYLNETYSQAEALLWLGVYLTLNLQLSSLNLLGHWLGGPAASAEFSTNFYWATWVLTWCLPPITLARGIGLRDRLVIAAGAVVATLTLITNKPYLGWPRHTWDPMLLGAFLLGVALTLRRWLDNGTAGIRYGFTAERLSARDKERMNAAAATFGLLSPHAIASPLRSDRSPVNFGGGDSGGGGASSDF